MLELNITTGEKYEPAMKITNSDKALKYFEECVIHTMAFGSSREEAVEIEKSNLGYWAGYYDFVTRMRVEKLFGGIHPFFGSTTKGAPTPEEAFKMGQDFAEKNK